MNDAGRTRSVSARVELQVTETAELIFAVAVAAEYATASERLAVAIDGEPQHVVELSDAHGTRLHRVAAARPGRLTFDYAATVDGPAEPGGTSAVDVIRYTRPSRYAESDALGPTALAEFGGIDDPAELLAAVSSWVGTHLAYVSGSSLPTDGAVRTLLSRQGVCRDYAHLTVALLRASGLPARLAAVYAPGLEPMDFHAVAEAWVDGSWRTVDATTLAPRAALVRIATGRDAADTAFLSVLSGRADLVAVEVTAVADRLPDDDVTRLVSIV
ncbi:transglutaminase family protein [Microbacterium betulae]|uniref:Transglutaminase family protein n=1 Tax=Microbacterium betulae TaxID=2981139 RepID=A0AA97I7R9_9MICO|nr:transglutaminase family protein [Microbacterium sp. AB]WOF23927.1 transglutaminase family protein [Microbacterium sp. AB]